jgi:hypothetical protein
VRHYQGKSNPQTVVSVDNFHSNTPKGIFDMVQCACLPCCENPTAAGKLGDLCNPDDHKICGPEPRPAPANAIIFTGVGSITSCEGSNKKNPVEQQVLFRIYIVDRSEPGGSHPGGQKSPPDVYCFQAWSLPNNASITDPNVIALRQQLANASCAFIQGAINTNPTSTTLLPSPNDIGNLLINDCGGLHTGNHQIHPSTGATCPVTP